MLKQRLITAAILVPLVVAAILYLPTNILNWLLALVVAAAAWEWLTIIKVTDLTRRLLWILGIVVLTSLNKTVLPNELFLLLAVIVWLSAAVIILKFGHTGLPANLTSLFKQQSFGIATTVILLSLFWVSSLILHQSAMGPQLLLYVLISVWLADTGGYFAGKKYGKTKLASVVSPNKSWEGVWGALVLTSIWALLAYAFGIADSISLVAWLVLTLLTVAISIVGDLFESLFKRSYQVKDSGNLLPGHGGVLDRIDSLLSAVPVFVAGLSLLGAI